MILIINTLFYTSYIVIMVLKLAVCEIFHPKIHGFDENSSPEILNHFMVNYSINTDEFMNKADFEELQNDLEFLNYEYNNASTKLKLQESDCIIRNYKNIINHPQYPHIDIVDIKRLSYGDEDVAILKTCWLRIFQRKCRSYCNYKKALIKHMRKPSSIMHREIHGKWPPFHYKKDD